VSVANCSSGFFGKETVINQLLTGAWQDWVGLPLNYTRVYNQLNFQRLSM